MRAVRFTDSRRLTPARLRWSYRLKVPLALIAVALLAGVTVATVTYLLVYRHVEANTLAQTQRLARTLSRSLVQPMLANDVWRAFQMVRASSLAAHTEDAAAPDIVVVDARGQVFVALDPVAHPVGTHLAHLPEPLAAAARWGLAAGGNATYLHDDESSGLRVVADRVIADEEVAVGAVLLQQEHGITRAQARAVAQRLAVLGAAAIAAVALLGWFVGRLMIRPLEKLRAAMQAAPTSDIAPYVAEVSRLNDEVGDLGRAFAAMMAEIGAKRELEREMLQAERLASIGRLTAGIAHEVNNPLGGMLHAIENRRLRGPVDDATARTLALLERGLKQIHATVGALLNEARRELHELRDDDLHDVYLLLQPEAHSGACALDWRIRAPAGRTLPSVPVRQVLLNLSLNAIAAAPGGRVRVVADAADGEWCVHVANTGAALDAQRFSALLEGQPRGDDGRAGLGLWITARILYTLGGRLELAATPPPGFATELIARFPLPLPTPLR